MKQRAAPQRFNIILASSGIGEPNDETVLNLIKQSVPDRSGPATIIMNSSDNQELSVRQDRLNRVATRIGSLGLEATELDLREYTGSKAKRKLTKNLGRFSLVIVPGGDIASLWKASVDSGFESALRSYLRQGGLYFGNSAGACIMGRLNGSLSIMDPTSFHEIPDSSPRGFRFVDTTIIPHLGTNSLAGQCVERCKMNNEPHVALADGEFILGKF